MSRRKNTPPDNTVATTDTNAVAMAEPQTEYEPKPAAASPPVPTPEWIDGPPAESGGGRHSGY